MKISNDCKLFLKDLYFYDIRSAYYQIAKVNKYEFNDINIENKTERNIHIGKKQIGNENLSKYLRDAAQGLIQTYIQENDIHDNEIIVTQTDGCILTRRLKDNSKYLKLSFREYINFIIISLDRKKFISISDDSITVKGISNRYPALDIIYNKFKNLNFYNKKGLFKQLYNIKNSVVNGDIKELYIIDRGGKKLINTKKRGLIEIKSGITFNVKNINRNQYYDVYFKDFMESLFLTFY